jgi:hypothetical protein
MTQPTDDHPSDDGVDETDTAPQEAVTRRASGSLTTARLLDAVTEKAVHRHYIEVPTIEGKNAELVFDSREEAAELFDLLKGTSDIEPFDLPPEE